MWMMCALIGALIVMAVLAAMCSPDNKKPVIIVLGEDGQPIKRKLNKDGGESMEQKNGNGIKDRYHPQQPWGGK